MVRFESDQELFTKDLATYQKVVSLNYMAHKEVYELHQVLVAEAPDKFVFADLACGAAMTSADALKNTRVGRYIGIDISQPSLDTARQSLSSLTCPVDLRCQDFVDAINSWDEPLDVVWIGQSLHHLRNSAKVDFMRSVYALLPRNGLFLIWEPTCAEGEDRERWFERFARLRPDWPMVTDEEFAAFDSHCRASDYAETASTWKALARKASFGRVDEIMTVPNQLSKVYRYSP